MAGYSGTPLPAKLGLKPDQRLAVSGAPERFLASLGPLPAGVRPTSRGLVDVKVCAIDETWSGLELVVRDRPAAARGGSYSRRRSR